jgi:UTP--glucose-1-phosphate uridylyltransferase
VPLEDTEKWGICDVGQCTNQVAPIASIVEKPKPKDAPSRLGVVGRYLFTPRIFDHLKKIQAGAGGEIQLTDGISRLLEQERACVYRHEGKRFDCGSKLGYLQATVAMGLLHEECGEPFAAHLRELKLSPGFAK